MIDDSDFDILWFTRNPLKSKSCMLHAVKAHNSFALLYFFRPALREDWFVKYLFDVRATRCVLYFFGIYLRHITSLHGKLNRFAGASTRMLEELGENLNFIRNLSSMSDFLHSTDSQSYWRDGEQEHSIPKVDRRFLTSFILCRKNDSYTHLTSECSAPSSAEFWRWNGNMKISLHTTRWKIVPPLPHIDAAAFASQKIIPIPQSADRKAMCTCRLYRHYVTTEQEHFATENKFNYLSKISQISFLAVVKSIHSYLPRWPRPPRYTSPPARPPTSANFSSLARYTLFHVHLIQIYWVIFRNLSRCEPPPPLTRPASFPQWC